jgi:DUF971 family protein
MTPPNNITLSKDKKILTISFKDDEYALTSEFLRVYSPSAEVRGHGPGQETLQLNKQDVLISSLVPMGNYAIAIHFSDGHTTGIYSWSYLLNLGIEKEELWKDYLRRIKANKDNNKMYHKVTI